MKNLESLKEVAFNKSIYSSGYICLLISRLLERYEGIHYEVNDLSNVSLYKWCLVPETFLDKSKSIIVLNDIDKVPSVNPKYDLEYIGNRKTMCLAPTFYRDVTSDINALSDKDIENYPYIQDFINFIFTKRINESDEFIFISKLKDYLKEFISTYEKYDKPSINNNKELDSCLIDRDVLFKSIKYIINKKEKNGSCNLGLDIVADVRGDDIIFQMYRSLEILFKGKSIKSCSYVGEFIEQDFDYSKFYIPGDIDLRQFISIFSMNYRYIKSDLRKDFKYVSYFLMNLFELSYEKEYVTVTDVEAILSNIVNDHKYTRTRK